MIVGITIDVAYLQYPQQKYSNNLSRTSTQDIIMLNCLPKFVYQFYFNKEHSYYH